MATHSLVIIAQIKNEERSLPRFLKTCEFFSDHIILLDQGSTDKSREIAGQFSKVKIFPNPDRHLNEANTISRMYEIARAEVHGPKVIIRLDADEVLTGNARSTAEWDTLKSTTPGTVLCFPRVEIFSFDECYVSSVMDRGYADDGREFSVKQIHANSTPIKAGGLLTLTFNKIKILHYSGLRRELGEAKMRYYCMLDNVYSTRAVFERRFLYRQGHILDVIRSTGKSIQFDEAWIKDYEAGGIDMTSVLDDQSTWHDAACIDLMVEYGPSRFFMDPIWYYDWESVIQLLPPDKKRKSQQKFRRPSRRLLKTSRVLDRIYHHSRLPLKARSKSLLNSLFATSSDRQRYIESVAAKEASSSLL